MSIIEVSGISFSYSNDIVLDDISFSIEKGDYVGIIGPNGSGKTTLLKLLLGLLKPQTGNIQVLGTSVGKLKKKYEVGYVPQRVSQQNMSFPATVYEVVESGVVPSLNVFERISSDNRKYINEVMKLSGIETYKDRRINDLSGGQRQRVYIARALSSKPKILILDEPFSGIDLEAQENFYGFLKMLNEQKGLTIIFVSHDVDVISKEVKHILCINKRLTCLVSTKSLNEKDMIEKLYGYKFTHIHQEK